MKKIYTTFRAFNEKYLPVDYKYAEGQDEEPESIDVIDGEITPFESGFPDEVGNEQLKKLLNDNGLDISEYSNSVNNSVDLDEETIDIVQSMFGDNDAWIIKVSEKNIAISAKSGDGILITVKQVDDDHTGKYAIVKYVNMQSTPKRSYFKVYSLQSFLGALKKVF